MQKTYLAIVLAVALSVPSAWAGKTAPDADGYTGTNSAVFSFIDLTTAGGSASVLANQDDAVTPLSLPFPFIFYGKAYSLVCVSSNGLAYFVSAASGCTEGGDFQNIDLTAGGTSGNLPAVIPYWTDLVFQGGGAVYYQSQGSAGSRRFVVQWQNAYPQATVLSANPVTFEMVLYETSNQILFQYKTVNLGPANPASQGAQATVGIRDASGNTNQRETQWSFDAGVLGDGSAILFVPAYAQIAATQMSVTSSGLGYNRVTQLYTGTITLKNIGTGTLKGPFQVALHALTSGVTLANATGTFGGTPYLTVTGVSALAAANSTTITVQFRNPSNTSIQFTPVVYSGSLQ